jgi:hypothetical protein
MSYLKTTMVSSSLLLLTIFLSKCLHNNSPVNKDPRGGQYAGAAVCVNCHRTVAGSYKHTNHYRTSSAIDNNSLKKLIVHPDDRFNFADSGYIRLEEKDNSFSQSYFEKDGKNTFARFDIAIGSAEKAQTYGYWKENKLYQLPLTWFTHLNTWANSPGFPAGKARFGRMIESRCFECHASYVDRTFVRSGTLAVNETLDRNSIIYGIDCERCHGPALQHVTFHQEHPSVKTAGFITSIKSLSRQQQLDLCAVCHSGNDQSPQRSLFAFAPGDTLSHFYYPDFGAGAGGAEPDVHGKQLQLLQSSLCFEKTDMTCTSCHSLHGPEENNTAAFLSQCMACHLNSAHAAGILKENEQKKRDFNLVGLNCIDCHMPLQTSKMIYFNNGAASKNIPYFLRTHKIAIYK